MVHPPPVDPEGLADDHVHDPLPHPLPHVQSQPQAGVEVSGDPDGQLAVRSGLLQGPVDPFDPGGHDGPAGFDFIGMEEVGRGALVGQRQLEPVHRIVPEHLFDEGEALLPDLRMLEVQTGEPGELRIEVAAGADLEVLVVQPEEGAAHVFLAGPAPALVHQQSGIEQHSLLVGPIAEHLQLIQPGVQQRPGVLSGPLEDHVGPLADMVSEHLSHPGVVKDGAAVPQAEIEHFHRGLHQLVHGSLHLLLLDGGLVHVHEGVAAVVVEHDARLLAGGAGPRPNRLYRRRRGQQARSQAGGQGGSHEMASFHRGLLAGWLE